MRVDFFCEGASGSTSFLFSPLTYFSKGLGGAEYALVHLAKTLAELGAEVHIWNTPIDGEGVYDGVEYHNVYDFDFFAHYDVFICYRNPFYELPYINANVRLWWSVDQVTCGDYAQDIKPFVSHSIVISQHLRQYHIDRYGFDPDKISSIDLGVRVEDYDYTVPKVPNRLLYCSVPSRGLEFLKDIFPRIRQQIPDAELVVTSDFSLWGTGISPLNQEYKNMFEGMAGVNFLGKVGRQELVELQLSSDLLAYPNAPSGKAYEENFSVSVAECQVAGAVPITSMFGGLQTTVINPTISLVTDMWNKPLHPSDPRYEQKFVDMTLDLLSNRERLATIQQSISTRARLRFNWLTIAQQWLDTIERVKQEKGVAYG